MKKLLFLLLISSDAGAQSATHAIGESILYSNQDLCLVQSLADISSFGQFAYSGTSYRFLSESNCTKQDWDCVARFPIQNGQVSIRPEGIVDLCFGEELERFKIFRFQKYLILVNPNKIERFRKLFTESCSIINRSKNRLLVSSDPEINHAFLIAYMLSKEFPVTLY